MKDYKHTHTYTHTQKHRNTILQALSVLPSFCNRVLSESSSLSTLNLKTKLKYSKPVNPSNVLWALICKISVSCLEPFNFNSLQDAAEVLQFVINELKGTSVAASNLISNVIKNLM